MFKTETRKLAAVLTGIVSMWAVVIIKILQTSIK